MDSVSKGEKPLSGTKHDSGKPPMELLPGDALVEISKVLGFGAQKYEAFNWVGGFKWGRLAGAALRHVFSWLSGEDKDPETGLSHLAHAACCLIFLITHEKRGLGKDDRCERFKQDYEKEKNNKKEKESGSEGRAKSNVRDIRVGERLNYVS
jgi:hypothetical protein